jgi:arylsulfatase A-like enzyme
VSALSLPSACQWDDVLTVNRSIDDNVGRLLDYLDASGLAENTLVMYTSDQGFFLGEHGWFDKRFIYEESFQMPVGLAICVHC